MSCNYSFSGSSLNPEIESATIYDFPNYSALQNPNLSQDFSLELQNRFDQRTKLELVEVDGDITIEGEITNYQLTPVTVQSDDTAAQTRLTITVTVRYENTIEPDKSFERTFSDFSEFDANLSLAEVEDSEVEIINDRLVNQIFNAIVADW